MKRTAAGFAGRLLIDRLTKGSHATRRGRGGEASALGDPRLLAFARGLSLGALLGAAIAGSTIWGRLRHGGR